MEPMTCPNCGAGLIEDVWESIQDQEDDGVILDALPVYVCGQKCGYMRQVEVIPQVAAQQGSDRLLLAYPDDQGRILDIRDSVLWPPMPLESLLARGYWEEYNGNHDIERLLDSARDSRAYGLNAPNLFKFATSELSQDAFLCWLMSWSSQLYRSIDRPLHEAAVDFISRIFTVHQIPVPVIESINITRQFQSLDILAIVNQQYAILIEDKTYTKNHSNQLVRYSNAVKAEYPDYIQLPIYYKIADQSHYRSVEQAGYAPFTRRMMLSLLKKGKENGVQNPIFIDYYKHLQQLDDRMMAFRILPIEDWGSYAWQGFYQELKKRIQGDWGYVPKRSGGFWAFWWKSSFDDGYYLQLEEQRLCVKVETKDGDIDKERIECIRNQIMLDSEARGLFLQKPARIRFGETMTIAFRSDYLQRNEDGTIDVNRTIEELRKY
ncbi:PD-(D/E)XK nuclease family protein [Neobacillus muris]|uniref:PD-(D/E)XK nuclease family protein n=1 Tax=Neobacillus muris TaxID=2941334 RepID=UPI002040D82C|nr:PD-(D/E)XK nuclease family protein [Neobacillus muris]